MARLIKADGKEIKLRALRPNAGIAEGYRKRLLALVAEMFDSFDYWLRAKYRAHEPVMARDETPAKSLDRELKRLRKRWEKRFDEAAKDLASYFAKAAARRSDDQLRSILRKGGWSVKFTMTAAMRDVLAATVAENVSLIKSIPEEFSTQVEGLVMRSVTAGRDLSTLSKELEHRYGITKRRATFIARDQNNKATAMLTRARFTELGITEAIWLHSGGGKQPRPTHVRNSGKTFDVKKGWYDPTVKQYIWPGTLPNCRCVSRPVVRGFS